MMNFDEILLRKKEIFEKTLFEVFNKITVDTPEILKKSMRYSLEAGGKRLRPILIYSVCEALDGDLNDALTVGCAIEFIHTYSLIHDDLPAMDNDDFRRGKPTNHKVFGEGIAILAGDALLTEAFYILSSENLYNSLNERKILKIMNLIAESAGSSGMVGGQTLDLIFENKAPTIEDVKKIHLNKTAKLIIASCLSGALIATEDRTILDRIYNYGKCIGLAFQIVDDILDEIGDEKVLGKKTKKDRESGKATFPSVVGLEKSKEIALNLVEDGKREIDFLKEKGIFLKQLSDYIVKRVS